MTDLSVILPTFNEAKNIQQMIDAVYGVLADIDAEVIVVDDESPDGTSEVVDRILNRHRKLRLITRRSNKGLVNSIKEGVKSSQGSIVLWMDADLSMPTDKIPDLLNQIKEGADLAVGSRYIKGGGIKGSTQHPGKQNIIHVWDNLRKSEDSFFAVTISKYGNLIARLVLDRRYYDYTSGYYAVRREVIDELGLEGDYLDYCIALLYRAARYGYSISEIPVTIKPRLYGKSKTSNNPVSVIPIALNCLITIIKLKLTVRRRIKNHDKM